MIFNNTKLIWKGDTFFIWFVSFQIYCKRAAFSESMIKKIGLSQRISWTLIFLRNPKYSWKRKSTNCSPGWHSVALFRKFEFALKLMLYRCLLNIFSSISNAESIATKNFQKAATASKWGHGEFSLAFRAANSRLKTNLRTPKTLLTD